MPTPNDFIAALPLPTGEADRALLRAAIVKRQGYALEDAEDPTDFVALDPNTGELPFFLAWHETIFWLDPDDATTVHDGFTVLVTDDAYRYKANDLDFRIRAVLDRDLTTPPSGSPAPEIGDAYLVPAGATGAWAGEAESIAVYTARGWQFRDPVIGEWLYIEDEDAYVRYTTSGDWTEGPGARSIAANSIPVNALINGGRTSFIVENQTTNAPPGSPVVGNAYIIGSSPTGLWAGKAAQIAVWESAGGTDWTYYVPTNGFQAYDKAQSNGFRHNGSVWISAGGSVVGAATTGLTTSGSTTSGGTTAYTYSATVAPTQGGTQEYREDSVTLSYAAKKTGARLRFTYEWTAADGNDVNPALFRDSESDAVDWTGFRDNVASYHNMVSFEVITSDISSHTYKVRLNRPSGGTLTAAMTRRRLSLLEFA